MHSLSEIMARTPKRLNVDSKTSLGRLAAVEGMTPFKNFADWQNLKQGNLVKTFDCNECLINARIADFEYCERIT